MKAKTLTPVSARRKMTEALAKLRTAEAQYVAVRYDVQKRCIHTACEYQSIYEDSHWFCPDCGGSWQRDPRKTPIAQKGKK